MPIDPYLADRMIGLEGYEWADASDGEGRHALERYATDPSPWVRPPVDVEHATVPGAGGPIPVRIYRDPVPNDGVVVWLHGGGFAGGDLDMAESDVVASELAHRTGCLFVTVDYRLAGPDVRFPLPVDDAQTAWRWARALVGAGRPAFLGGASAGAAIALATAVRERGLVSAPDGLLLAYPFAHFPVPALDDDVREQMAAVPKMLRFDTREIERMVATYVGRIVDVPSLALPGAHALDRLPRTLVVAAEFDDLRPSAELLVRQLSASGVEVRRYLARGMLHGHLNRTPALREVDVTLATLAAFIAVDESTTSGSARNRLEVPLS